MRLDHRLVQERERALEDRLRLLLETLDEQAHRDLRGDLAAGVAPHSVGDDEQQRVAAVRVRDPVLVDGPRALARLLEDRESHSSVPARPPEGH